MLQQQRDIYLYDEICRKKHQVEFDAALNGAQRLLRQGAKGLQEGPIKFYCLLQFIDVILFYAKNGCHMYM